MQKSWRFNAVEVQHEKGAAFARGNDTGHGLHKDDMNILGKRATNELSFEPNASNMEIVLNNNIGVMVPVGNTAGIVDQFEGSEPLNSSGISTPQKMAIKRSLR